MNRASASREKRAAELRGAQREDQLAVRDLPTRGERLPAREIAARAIVGGVASSATASFAPGKVMKGAAATTKAVAAKLAVVIAVSAAGAGAAYLHRPAAKPPAVVRHEARAMQPPAEVVAMPLHFAQETCVDVATGCGVAAGPQEAEAPSPEPTKRVRRQRVQPEAAPPKVVKAARQLAPTPRDTLQGEARMLAQARARLRAGDLAGAEQTLNDARDRFAQGGSLGQEREVLQIELLAKLGDSDGADHRARRFLRKHPDSPHAKTVQRFLTTP